MLRELRVRPDASRKLHLPMVMKQGCVDFVRLKVGSLLGAFEMEAFRLGYELAHISERTVLQLPLAVCLLGLLFLTCSDHPGSFSPCYKFLQPGLGFICHQSSS